MSKTILIKLTKAGSKAGPFDIKDQFGNTIESGVPKETLITGITKTVDDSVTFIKLVSTGDCISQKTKQVGEIYPSMWSNTLFKQTYLSCAWRHLTNVEVYNSYYGKVQPYIIEYPFATSVQDEILQSVIDYSKVYKYIPDHTGVFDNANKIELNDVWFNKAIVYNGQQSSGVLKLFPKPKNSLKQYMSYPILENDSKSILYTKSDNLYQYNTFWSVVKDKTVPLFLTSCESLSIDKTVNQSNMDYLSRSYQKDTLRGKEIKIRHILDNRSDVHIVSQFLIVSTQISYK